ncbi:MAG: C25 family cysteine peptidase, partial [Candidatus Omnitrophica bacterium]|nr:C25 family cysteine peptidase [Candidatus Omnitrophota bacterium]
TQTAKNQIILCADKEINFTSISDRLLSYLTSDFKVYRLYLSNYTKPEELTQNLIQHLGKGVCLLNYVGHGSVNLWSREGVLDSEKISLLDNKVYPFVVSFTCLDGYFIDLDYESLAELLVKKDSGGSIATWSSAGLGLPRIHQQLNSELFKNIFLKGKRNLGLITTQTKLTFLKDNSFWNRDLLYTYNLLGDPALSLNILALPEKDVPPSDHKEETSVIPSLEEFTDPFEEIYAGLVLNPSEVESLRDKNQEAVKPKEIPEEIFLQEQLSGKETSSQEKLEVQDEAVISNEKDLLITRRGKVSKKTTTERPSDLFSKTEEKVSKDLIKEKHTPPEPSNPIIRFLRRLISFIKSLWQKFISFVRAIFR